ncbi:MAG TPA: GH1 family beta-glucosidase [Steroidobacteraceae bacterium]|nr:GH1 family beta-glucosidase [Steroidobacteraceae bacterium]
MSKVTFPTDFLWGVATSAYQIEGAAQLDGRGESIWDRFCRTPGKIAHGANGDVACDHYRRFAEDVALMRELGVSTYRFSIAWPRIVPHGRGAINEAGLDFYDRLVDMLQTAGIQPFATLFHWDLPQPLQETGGWARRETAEAFGQYAHVVARRLGDRVHRWITHNEPWCTSMLGYQIGKHAPGLTSWPAALAASHHLLLSHGRAVEAIRDCSKQVQVGIALNLCPAHPASASAADADAARHFDGNFNRWFLDPLFGRGYPADMLRDYAADGRLPDDWETIVARGDLADIAKPLDFLGVNYYYRAIVRSTRVPEHDNAPRTRHAAPESQWTDMGWEVYPAGLYETLLRLHREYSPASIFITENGASFPDSPDSEGRIRDTRRTEYLRDHFLAAHRAIDAGVPLAGYFVWSLLDNFEWERGYTQRFGIVWVDYDTQERRFKDSALWYREVIAANAVEPASITLPQVPCAERGAVAIPAPEPVSDAARA